MSKVKLLWAVLILLATNLVSAQGNPDDAHKLVGEGIHALLQRIEQLKSQPEVDEKARIAAVEEILGPMVDFKRIARRVMAKHYKKASKEQRKTFYLVFKNTLLNTYAKGLWEFEDYKIRLKPLKKSHTSQRNTKVELDVITASGQVFSVVQSLFFHKKYNVWMVQNVIISGVNIGQLFREQFARLVSESDGNIDEAITAWQSITQSNAATAQGQ